MLLQPEVKEPLGIAHPPRGYALAAACVAAASAVGLVFSSVFTTTDIAMLYLLAVVVTATWARPRVALVTSAASIACFDFLFVPPRFTFAVSDARYVLTFAVMLIVALVMARLTAHIRAQAEQARARELRMAAAYSLGRDIAAAGGPDDILAAAARHIEHAFDCRVETLVPDGSGRLATGEELAQWVFENGLVAGRATEILPASRALYLPLNFSDRTWGVVRVESREALDPERRQLLQTFVAQEALALERALLTERQHTSRVEIEAERLRTSLLSSLSHDLRTPLAGIEGAASSLLEERTPLGPEVRREHARTILEESQRMTRLIGNLLDMVRLETGALVVQKEWQPLEEVVGVALIRLDQRLGGRPVTTLIPADLPLVPIDGILIEQVLINLLENAMKYTPASSPIEIAASAEPGQVNVSVADRGPGLPAGEEERIFDKFHRVPASGAGMGIGLGLTICRGIVTAHGGRITAENRAGGGAVFRFTLPLAGPPLAVVPDEPAEALRADA